MAMKISRVVSIGLMCISALGLMKCMKPIETNEQANLVALANTSWSMQDGEINFSDDSYHAYLGCNQLNGQFNQSDNTVDISPEAMTKMGCPENHPENHFLRDFHGLFSIIQNGDQVILSRDDVKFSLN